MASFFVCIDTSVSKESADALPRNNLNQGDFFTDEPSGSCIVADARIDYRQELAEKLGLSWNIAKGYSDDRLILIAYLKWGEACLSHLYGDFSFVIWDPVSKEVFCARDHLGCRPLYYVDRPGYLAVASQITAFRNLPGFRFEIREQYILDAICSIESADTLSAYKGIVRLKPAHFVKQINGQLSDQYRYWDLRINETYTGLTLKEATGELRNRFIEAIRQRSQRAGRIGVELSGGLDSSGIAAALALLLEQKGTIQAFTHAVSSDGITPQMNPKHEMEFCTALLEKYSSIKQFLITGENSEGSYQALTDALKRLHKPVNLHYALNSDLLFKEAGKQDITIMFSGLGGDEGITSDGDGYWNELLFRGQHSKLRDHIRSTVVHRGSLFYRRLIKAYLNFYAPWMLKLFTKDWRKSSYASFALHKPLARKYRMKRKFFKMNSLPVKPDVRAMEYFRILYPNKPERIEETSLLSRPHGIEYRYPFLDVKLLEFFHSLPPEYKYRDGMGRYLFRRAMKGMLPDKIRMRTDKGGNTIPNVFARVLKDGELFREIIDEGRLKNQYHYVDYTKLHKMLDSFMKMGETKRQPYDLRAFQSAVSVLILQKWQRKGEVDIGIKC